MKLTIIMVLLLSLVACGCNPIKYQGDLGFMNSAHANSMEYYVKIGGKTCKDMDNKVGLCAKRIASNAPLQFALDAREYGYTLSMRCSKAVDTDFSVDVEKGQSYSFSIAPEKFSEVRTFTCIGEVFPHDRDQEVSANFHVRVIVFDGDYVEREIVYEKTKRKKKYLVFGKHARYVHYDGKRYKKKPILKVDDYNKFGYSESERMRFNYYGNY